MKVSVVGPEELTPEQVGAWHRLLSGVYSHPCFSPEFAQLVANVHPHARVAVMQEGERYGFFPFQSDGGRVGLPIGHRLNDFQGMIVPADWEIDLSMLLRECGLDVWRFDHLVDMEGRFAPLIQSDAGSPWIDLGDGYDAYCDRLRQSGSSAIKQAERKSRKMERELGPLRFVVHESCDRPFELLSQWKTQYIRALGAFPLFETPWIIELLRRIREFESRQLRGRMSVLYAGDRVAAVHLGMCNDEVCHWWITSYDNELHQYSPGTILLLRLAEAMASQGVQRLELGKGDETYKLRLMTDQHQLGEGSIARTSSRRLLEKVRQQCRTTLRDSSWKPLVQKTKSLARYGAFSKPHP